MTSMTLHHLLDVIWYRKSPLTVVLLPLSWLYQLVCLGRKLFYRYAYHQKQFPVPVIVVGNLTVGGTGKTPLVAAIANYLIEQNLQPGIVMRGYHGQFEGSHCAVTAKSDPFVVGEEAVLLAQKTGCPVMIGANRPNAIEKLLAQNPEVTVVLSDDGLQHDAMARDIEIVVIDGERRFGNGLCLPAGPLRESLKRLKTASYVIVQGGALQKEAFGHWRVQKQLSKQLLSVNQSANPSSLSDWRGQTVHAVAGIGDPALFFEQLKAEGLKVIPHAFPDHYHYSQEDVTFDDAYPVLMTEKDAVKCRQFTHSNLWCVPLEMALPEKFQTNLLRRIEQWIKNSSRSWLAQSANNPLIMKK